MLDDTNISSSCNIPKINGNYTISGTWTFSTEPALPTLTTLVKAYGGINLNKAFAYNFLFEYLASVPGYVAADKGRIIYCTGDNKFYGANNAAWTQMDYTGAYSGGAVRSYTSEVLVDSNVDGELFFVTEGASPTVLLNIKGRKFPASFYTELGVHTHAFTGTAHNHGVTDTGHVHGSIPTTTHTHDMSHATGNQSANHTHSVSFTSDSSGHIHGYSPGTLSASETGQESPAHTHTGSCTSGNVSADHTHSYSGDTGAPSATGNTASATTGIAIGNTSSAGTNANAGINGGTLNDTLKLYPDTLSVYIDTTDITTAFLAAASWAKIGDGTATHAFYTTGSGEIDISAMATMTAGYHYIRITEPIAKSGCRTMVHISSS